MHSPPFFGSRSSSDSRLTPKQSKAPALARDSMTFLFRQLGSARLQKSSKLVNGPPFCPGLDHTLGHRLAHVADRRQAEQDLVAPGGEVQSSCR